MKDFLRRIMVTDKTFTTLAKERKKYDRTAVAGLVLFCAAILLLWAFPDPPTGVPQIALILCAAAGVAFTLLGLMCGVIANERINLLSQLRRGVLLTEYARILGTRNFKP